MKAAVVALACLLRLAGSAQAEEGARPVAPAAAADARPTESPAQRNGGAPLPAKAVATQPAVAIQPGFATPPGAIAKAEAKPRAEDQRREALRARVCFNTAQTRETVAVYRLAEPFRALRVGGLQGEALRAKLCKWKQDEFVYEISVLRRDGRIVRLYMNAQNGQAVGALDDRH